MNVLYIANPCSLHDARWINFFSMRGQHQCYVLARELHYLRITPTNVLLDSNVTLVGFVRDPSTIRPWRNKKEVAKIKTFISKYHINVLHILYAEPNALWATWREKVGVPVIITTRGTDILKTIPAFFQKTDLLSKFVATQYRRAFAKADVITCTSHSQQQALEKIGVKTSTRIIRTGIDMRVVDEALMHSQEKDADKFILMPRHMRAIYNHEFALAAISQLHDGVRNDYIFVFVDSDTEEPEYLAAIKEKAMHIPAKFKFLPSLSHHDLVLLIRNASLVVMTPLSDGSPVTAMETMACSTPLILPPLPYDPEIFADVVQFKSWDPSVLAGTINQVLSMPAKDKASMLSKNRQVILEKCNAAGEMKKIEEIYQHQTADIR